MKLGESKRRYFGWRKMKQWIVGCSVVSVLLLLMLIFKQSWESPAQIWIFAGKFHPLFLHLPIGMLVIVVLMEGLAKFQERKSHASMPLAMATLTSVLAVIFGYILMRSNTYPEDAIDAHLYSGVIFTVCLIWTLFFKLRFNETGRGQKTYWTLLMVSTALMFAAGHYGGVITHGDPLDEAPWVKKKSAERAPAEVDDRLVYEHVVVPILEEKCYKCHGPKKKKGKLRMDSYEAMLKGGAEGPCLVPGDLTKSLMIEFIRLPMDDEYRMPPEDKPQLTGAESKVIEWWVETGAPRETKLASLEIPDEVRAALEQVSGESLSQNNQPEEREAKTSVTPEKDAAAVQAAHSAEVTKLQAKYPGVLTWVSQSDGTLSLNTAGMRADFKDVDLKNFQPLSALMSHVDLTAASVTDASASVLASMTALQSLRLAETQITDQSLSSIVRLKGLESLNLYGTAITDDGVLQLAALPQLKHLYLWGSQVTPAAVKTLQAKLPDCEINTGANVQ